MAITTTLLNISTTRVTTSVPKLTQADLILKDTTIVPGKDKDTYQEITVYTLGTSTIEPLEVTVKRAIDAKADTVHYSIKVATMKRSVDADGIVVESAPVEGGLWITRPMSDYDVTDSNIEAMIGNVYALYHAGVDGSNVPTTTLLNKLRLGVTNIF